MIKDVLGPYTFSNALQLSGFNSVFDYLDSSGKGSLNKE